MKNSSIKGMKFIESTEPHSDIPKIIINIFPSSGRFLYRKRKCLKGEKSVTASSILTVIMYVPSSEAMESSPSSFGAKVNNIQIDDISFIEHLSFKAFNEGIRLKVRCLATDSIYANNVNRKFCTRYGISISFVRKGRAAKDEPDA